MLNFYPPIDNLSTDSLVVESHPPNRLETMNCPETTVIGSNHNYQQFELESSERIAVIEKLLSIGTALSGSSNLKEILTLILTKSREITCSDAGSVYLLDKSDEIPKLIFKVTQNDSLPQLSFQEFAVELTDKSLSGYVALNRKSLNIPDAYNIPANLPYKLNDTFDRDFSYRTCSVLVLPMQDQKKEVIGVLQLLNRKKSPDLKITPDNALEVTQPYSDWEERLLKSLASQAAISIERNMLHESIENLFEGFVRASVQAIEARDPTTSGHSERVADLTVRLGEEINSISEGKLSNLYFSDRQIQEIRYAALLHDFGKIGVPEAILNKRKKLYPYQLEIIRQRFAVAQRTLEVECAQSKFRHLVEHPDHQHSGHSPCSHCQKLADLDQQLSQEIESLSRYWRLIQDYNEPEAIQTKRFASLSDQELMDMTMLAQYRYLDIDGQMKPLVSGEDLQDLMLPRGNLNEEERLAMEAHVTHSYEFLRQIPWTKDLAEIPVIAYGHHEKLDGTGYPRRLRGDEIPIQTQMMMIADVYDALTATDRPYKKPLPLSVAIRILREEADKQKINADLVAVFEQRQVFKVLGH